MSDSSGAKKQRTDAESFFDRLNGLDGNIKKILYYLNKDDGYSFVQVLKEGLFKPKNDDTEKAIQEKKDFMNSLDTFLAKCTRLYELIERYKIEFERGTPIVCACEHGRMDDVELFVNLHPFHKYITNRGMNGYRDDMTLKEYVNQVGKRSLGDDCTPLMIAANNEHFQVVKYLIEQGEADPSIADSDGWNALHWAASNNETNTDLIELLLSHMSLDSINKKQFGGYTPLDLAYRFNRSPIRQEIIALLRSKGGKANEYDEDGNWIIEDGVPLLMRPPCVNINEEVNQLLKF